MGLKDSLENLRSLDVQDLLRDFKGLDPNDPGQWPLAPRVATLLAIFFVLVVGGWWFDWSDQLATLEAKEREEATLKEDWVNKKRQAVNLPEYRRQLSEIDRQFGAAQAAAEPFRDGVAAGRHQPGGPRARPAVRALQARHRSHEGFLRRAADRRACHRQLS
jgi:hypothetical protein